MSVRRTVPSSGPVIAVPPPQGLRAEPDNDRVIDDRFPVIQPLEVRSHPSEILAVLQAEPGKHIADIGAADGAYSFRIAPRRLPPTRAARSSRPNQESC